LLRLKDLLLFPLLVWAAGATPGQPVIPATAPVANVTCHIWRNVVGSQITDTLATDDLARRWDETRSLDDLEFAPDFKDSWACTLTGIITPPRSGAYWFSIAARDSGVLYLSKDESAANLRYIAQTPAATNLDAYSWYSAQRSKGILLQAGKRYLIQAIEKSGPGPGGISIAWHGPGGLFEGPIGAERFVPSSAEAPLPSFKVNGFKLSLAPAQPLAGSGVVNFIRGAHLQVNGESTDLSYLIDLPRNFDSTIDKKPMLVFLHGSNRQGFDLQGMLAAGPVFQILARPELNQSVAMMVLCPQLPPDWRWDTPGAAQAVNSLVHQLCGRYARIDSKRIYLTGLSMGGKGTWITAEDSPETYAAVVPISAVDVRADIAPRLLKDVPEIRIVCGGDDAGFAAGSRRMYEALKPTLNDRVQLTAFEHEHHMIWDHLYSDPGFYESLMKFSRQ
jgi:pimeloyl-ACP methyl ester carboxylesterase